MKKIMPVLLIAVLAFGGYYVVTSGMLTGTGDVGVNAPKDGPDLPDVHAPDADDVGDGVGDAAEGVENGAKTAADTIAGLSPAVWRVVGLVLVVLALAWIWRNPGRRTVALLIALLALAVFVVSSQ